ncbi:MAG: S1C family serine protease [Micrococcales bacterium]
MSNNQNSQYVYDAAGPSQAPARMPAASYRRRAPLLPVIAISAGLSALISGGTAVAVFGLSGTSDTVIVNNSDSVNWVTAVAKKASNSVATISVSDSSGDAGTGSGIVLTSDGYILTNTHVVTLEGATAKPSIDVKTADGKVYGATVVGTDPTNDLAVVKIRPLTKLTAATFANSDKLNVGDNVVAIGAPLGLDATVTSGIISALNRTIQVANSAPSGGSGGGLKFLGGGNASGAISITVIQTDAAINPGNSGGALLNDKGQVIGVNSAIATASSSSVGGQSGSIGVGFSIPGNTALRIAHEIIKSGKANHAMLGAYISDAVTGVSSGFSTGAKVESLMAKGPAEKAGLKKGDVVTEFNGKPVATASDLTADVRAEAPGSKVTLTVLRAGTTLKITVTLGNAVNLK